MKLSWFQSIIFGLISGITEFLPVSGDAHRKLFTFFSGVEAESGTMFFIRFGCLAAVVACCRKQLIRIMRERRYAAIPKRRRKRGPDLRVIATSRLMRIGSIPIILAFLGYGLLSWMLDYLWIVSITLVITGVILYLPRRFPTANKDARSMSALDALVMGTLGAAGGIPGFSRVAFMTAVGSLQGGDRKFILDMCLLLCIPALLVGSVIAGIDFFSLGNVTFTLLIRYIFAGLSAFTASCCGIVVMRFLAYKIGFSGFAYYNWGLALFTFIIYLII